MSGTGDPANPAVLFTDQTPAAGASADSPPAGTTGGDADTSAAAGEGAAPGSPSTPAAGEGAGGDGTPAPSAGGDEPPKEPAPAADPNAAWKAKKYDTVYAKLKAAEAERDALKAGKPVLSDEEIAQRAAQLQATNDFNRRCNEVAEAGKKAFGDFSEKIGNLRQVVAVKGDPAQEKAYGQMIEAILETGSEAARITYELGSNLELAEEIMNLSPVKQAAKLAELAAKKGEPEPSGAPKPITPVGQRGGAGELIKPEDPTKADKLSTKEWMARREADVQKKRQAGMRIW